MSKVGNLKTLGGGLAGAVALATGTSTYGTVVTVSPLADLTTTPGGPNTIAQWDMNGDGLVDFTFSDRYPNTQPGSYGIVWQTTVRSYFQTNGFVGRNDFFYGYAFPVHYGESISPSSPDFTTLTRQILLGEQYTYLDNGTQYTFYGGYFAGVGSGSVPPGTFAFAGFRFFAADGIHYGWVRLRVSAGVIDFFDAAYESEPNVGIVTPTTPVPEPGTLALLALGAVGLIGAIAKRRRG